MVHRSRRTDGARLTLDYTARVSGALADDGAVLRALADKIRDVPNFPKEGILFKDITSLLQDANAFKQAVDIMADTYRGRAVELVVGVESRGFIFGGALAYLLDAGFVPDEADQGGDPASNERLPAGQTHGAHADAGEHARDATELFDGEDLVLR